MGEGYEDSAAAAVWIFKLTKQTKKTTLQSYLTNCNCLHTKKERKTKRKKEKELIPRNRMSE